MRGSRIWFGGFLLVSLVSNLLAQEGQAKNGFSGKTPVWIGKEITVLWAELSQGQENVRVASDNMGDRSVQLDHNPHWFGILAENMKNEKFPVEAQGLATMQAGRKGRIIARIIGKNDAGDYIIQGKHVTEIDHQKEIVIFSGVIHPQDINQENSVLSTRIYNARVFPKKSTDSHTSRGGMLTHLFRWIFEE